MSIYLIEAKFCTGQGLRLSSDYIKKEVLKCQNAYFEDFTRLSKNVLFFFFFIEVNFSLVNNEG